MPSSTYTVEKIICLQYQVKAAFAMRRRGYPGHKRAGFFLAGIGAAMIIFLILPWWFWWLGIAISFLCGGIWLLKR